MTAPPERGQQPGNSVAGLYSRASKDYGRLGAPFFAHAGRRLVELAEVHPGQRVLDVACGRGAVLIPAAERVGPTGYVLGIDLSPGMVEETADELRQLRLTWAETRVMDAHELQLADGSFDMVLCSFAVFWFAELELALGEMRRVLKTGGSIGFAFARGTDPRWRWYEALLGHYGVLQRLPPQPGRQGIRAESALTQVLTDTGFASAREIVEETELAFRDAEDWWASLWTHGSRIALEAMTHEELNAFKAECMQRVQRQQSNSGELPITYRLVYVLGVKDDVHGHARP